MNVVVQHVLRLNRLFIGSTECESKHSGDEFWQMMNIHNYVIQSTPDNSTDNSNLQGKSKKVPVIAGELEENSRE